MKKLVKYLFFIILFFGAVSFFLLRQPSFQDKLLDRFELANNNYLLILMLLRVYRYTKPFSKEERLLTKEMNRLWK